MRRFLGFPVLVLGVVFAAYVYYPAAFDRPKHFAAPAQVFDDLVLGPQIAPEPRPMSRSFAPRDPAFTMLDPQRAARLASAAPVPVPASRATIALGLGLRGSRPNTETTALVDDVAISPWRSVVQTAPRPDVQRVSTRAKSSAARYALARDIQRELRRVGCYWGKIDGSWGTGSKRSMSEFMERVNAALPLDEPDIVFLSLLTAHPSETCGRSCPAGQSLDGAGRCLPDVILAQKAKRTGSHTVRVASWMTEVSPTGAGSPRLADPAPPLPGRMAIGGPRFDPAGDNLPGPAMANGGIETAALAEPVPGEAKLAAALPPDADMGAVTFVPSPEAAERPTRRSKVRASEGRAKPRGNRARYSNYRAVKHLFLHPLGRM
jgi:hypothetical protein